jgi:hypothetical protein
MAKGHYRALLSLLTITVLIILFVAGQSKSTASLQGVTSLPHSSPDTVWSAPVDVSTLPGYDNAPYIAASPPNGAAMLIWGYSNGTDGGLANNNNQSLGGPFGQEHIIDPYAPSLVDVMGYSHDNLGRRHAISWLWPQGGTLCDYYKQFNTAGSVVINETIPGSCDANTPRKLGGIAVDSNLTVHIALGRNNEAGSIRYWERTNAGVWTVQGEPLPASCAPGDLALTVSSQGTVMVAWKDCGGSGQGSDIITAVRLAANNWQVDNISSACCVGCPNTSGAYLPHLAPDPSGGIRAAWADGRCVSGGPTDIYYREWVPGSGWNGKPIVQVVANSGQSYYPSLAVDGAGEAHIAWGDDTQSPFAYYRIFYSHGHGTVFTAPEVPFNAWFPSSWQRDPSLDFAFNAVHIGFSSVRDDPNKDTYYSYTNTAPPPTPTPVPPPCPSAQFKDVCPGSTFYTNITNLANANIVSGYTAAPPCPNSGWIPCFLPGNTATRGQVSKIITLGANLPININGGPHFTDVPTNSTFYQYIETMYNAGIIAGYTSGCPSGNPCFKPNNNVTRGQLSKMASLAFNFNEAVSGQTFQDVPPGSTFYTYIQRLNGRGIINGYSCGGAGEPCVPPGNLPYFRPNNNVTRGQIAKIVDLCRQQP